MADEAGPEGGAVGERKLRRAVLAMLEDEAMPPLRVPGAEEPGKNDPRGDGAPDLGRVGASRGEVEVVDDVGVGRRFLRERGAELLTVRSSSAEGDPPLACSAS